MLALGLVALSIPVVRAQDSLASRQLDAVVISATRSERALSELPVPVTVISQQQIKNMGSLRLNDVLAEQTGLTLVSDHGTGIQMQGFAPEYTLILIDGEPLIGRAAGTLELNRIAVGNIRQVEIMKGPSSSLYGSEALAGVVNIITDRPAGTSGTITTRYGANQTTDFSGTVNYQREKLGIYAFANRYSTDGYDLTPDTDGKTVSPFTNYTYQTRVSYDLSSRTKFSLSGRYFTESQSSVSSIADGSDIALLDGKGTVKDWNVNPVMHFKLSDKWKTTLRFYHSKYSTTSTLNYRTDGAVYDDTYFDQTFLRPEVQVEYFVNTRNVVTLGVGRIWESVAATRYDNRMTYQTNYAYAQYEWQPLSKLNVLAGGRFDQHSAYGSQFSPKLSAQYDVNHWLSVRGSFGVGFKAPDFRQLYLNFTNSTVGYTVLGSEELLQGIARLQQDGQIDAMLADPATFGELKAESSRAYNLGVKLVPAKRVSVSLNAFRNDIRDIIDTKPVARKTNGQFVYSYYNLAQVFTQGAEMESSFMATDNLTLSLGYQYLVAKDKAVIDQLNAGEVYARDPETNVTRRVKANEYGGLFNRSRHMLNAKLFYNDEAHGWSATLRAIYRGRYGFADMNNNVILDDDSEYVKGYATVNLSVAKTIRKSLRLQAGCDNLLDYSSPQYIPTLPGRLLWVSAAFTLSKKNKSTL
ncbi:TonB-dependent receptor [Chryseolinea sp. Jin1]|uniref:TonB-dependent receptor n=2 Tax=Chryseolinea lacunae TaxID=2801331 RepID=A0ABS1KYI3_9BACT|nr:TonB-dependent receptor [Chryseolinea lacunae]